MEKKILEFIGQLRRGGVKVSLVETLDCFNALKLIEWNKDTFYYTLLTSLVKEKEDYRLFDKLFYFYFSEEAFFHQGKKNFLAAFVSEKKEKPEACEELSCGGVALGLGGGLGQGKNSLPLSAFVNIIKLGSSVDLNKLIEKGIESLGEIKENDLRNREELVRKVKVFLQWKMGEYELEKGLGPSNAKEAIELQERLNIAENLLQEKLDQTLLSKFKDKALEEILRKSNLKELDFYSLSSNQVQDIKRKITQLAHKLSTRVSRRESKAKRGKIELRVTIRKAMATGGVPLYPSFKGKKPSRPEFVILCDLSGSVRLFSEFMLQLVYSIQDRFIHVRSFAFVDTVHEITPYFRGKEINEGIREIYYYGRFSKTGFSHYGESLQAFNNSFLNIISRRTTVLILGDARNNYQKPNAEELLKIQGEAYRIIWLNPAARETWNTEDSIIDNYKPYCDKIFECRNLLQLEALVKDIF